MDWVKPAMTWWKGRIMTEQNQTEAKFYRIAKVSDVPDGERLFFEIEGQPIVLFVKGNEYYATGDVCSHDQGPVGDGELEGYEIICPRHGARFDIRTGKVLQFPAVTDIPSYPVRVQDGYIEVGIQEK